MLEKGVIVPAQDRADQFVSALFVIRKKDGGKQRPVADLRDIDI